MMHDKLPIFFRSYTIIKFHIFILSVSLVFNLRVYDDGFYAYVVNKL